MLNPHARMGSVTFKTTPADEHAIATIALHLRRSQTWATKSDSIRYALAEAVKALKADQARTGPDDSQTATARPTARVAVTESLGAGSGPEALQATSRDQQSASGREGQIETARPPVQLDMFDGPASPHSPQRLTAALGRLGFQR